VETAGGKASPLPPHFYGALGPWFDKTWKPNEFESIE